MEGPIPYLCTYYAHPLVVFRGEEDGNITRYSHLQISVTCERTLAFSRKLVAKVENGKVLPEKVLY